MNKHHLVLGKINDFLTGETIDDTLDERYRQKIVQILVFEKKYKKNEILSKKELIVKIDTKSAIIKIDFLIQLKDKICMIIKYGPGSLVTRYRPAIAASRLTTSYQIPVIVVTNGEDADMIDCLNGKVLGKGFNAIPDRNQLNKIAQNHSFNKISSKRKFIESRILYTFEVDGACPCDDDICIL